MTTSSSSRGTVLVGVCGGIAAYKVVDVVSRLRKAGLEVRVAMSHAAQQFVTPLTFSAISGHAVLAALFPADSGTSREEAYPHLYPATRADVFLVAPATADMIAKLVQGLGDDTVSTSALSLPSHCLRVFCPAMNVEMWNQPVVQNNVAQLEQAGWLRVGPEAGELACGMEGQGRMSEPAAIEEFVLAALSKRTAFAGRRLLIISGPTREHLDPVRFIGNPSTGKMGKALAEEALAQGAEVDFVTGPVAENHLPRGPRLHTHPVVSADDMMKKAQSLYDGAHAVVYAAAVADYRPVEFHDKKLPKRDGELTLRLEATPDVAATLNAAKRPGQVTIGFALQTHDGVQKARAKLQKKHLDGIVLNSLDALGGETGTYTYLRADNGHAGDEAAWGLLTKRECARRILGEVAGLLGST
jgi:phosphopantothenoylcysteine decarboxylase/phosphopantothenate--cysteine ligase